MGISYIIDIQLGGDLLTVKAIAYGVHLFYPHLVDGVGSPRKRPLLLEMFLHSLKIISQTSQTPVSM